MKNSDISAGKIFTISSEFIKTSIIQNKNVFLVYTNASRRIGQEKFGTKYES